MVGVCMEYVGAGDLVQDAMCKAGKQYRYMCWHRGVYMGTAPGCGKQETFFQHFLHSFYLGKIKEKTPEGDEINPHS
jgi:hypothetical protein